MELLEKVEKDIQDFFAARTEIFAGESDLQMALAVWLSTTNNYDHIHTEYFIPVSILPNYYWGNKDRLHIDIVVEKDGKYLPIELKYHTNSLGKKNADTTRFGQSIGPIEIIKTQNATNLSLYNSWKDVCRLELLEKKFKNVVGGIALTVTNTPLYWKKTKSSSAAYLPFTMTEGATRRGIMNWEGEISKKSLKTHPNGFQLIGSYTCNWVKTAITADDFRYCLLKINDSL